MARSQKNLPSKPHSAPPGGAELDPIDRRILSALRSDGRLTMNELGEKVGLSPSPCWTRVKRLENAGLIAEKFLENGGGENFDDAAGM